MSEDKFIQERLKHEKIESEMFDKVLLLEQQLQTAKEEKETCNRLHLKFQDDLIQQNKQLEDEIIEVKKHALDMDEYVATLEQQNEQTSEELTNYKELWETVSSYITFMDLFKLMPKDVECATIELMERISQQALGGE